MNQRFKRTLSMILAVMMLVSMMPVSVFADEGGCTCVDYPVYLEGESMSATCISSGYAVYSCLCGLSRNYVEVPATGMHSYVNGACEVCFTPDPNHQHNHVETVTLAPTCEGAGYATYTCACGDSFGAEIPAAGHSYVNGACTVCYAPDPNHEHSYVAGTTVAPTCEAAGYTPYTCACGDTYNYDFVDATGHSYVNGACEVCYAPDPNHEHNHVETVTLAPTCEGAGYATYTCACGDSFGAEIPAAGHSYVNGACEVCYAPDPNHEHSYVAGTPVDPTCVAAGYTPYTCACGDSYEDNFVDATGHSYVNFVCTVCSHFDALGKLQTMIDALPETVKQSEYADYLAKRDEISQFIIQNGITNEQVYTLKGIEKLSDPVMTIDDSVATINGTGYASLADALTAAQDGETVYLKWAEGDAPIAMNGSVFGKTVTITGTANVDWSKGFLFVGRGGAGNGTVIFDNAILTSASNSASHGIHVSGREKNTTDKYDGTLEIRNSTIVLDYLINKGTMTLDNSTLTVKNGFSLGGRPASETESGVDATATVTLNNGSRLIVNNHNGMGLGYEAIGVLNIDSSSAFEATQAFLVTTKGTMNVNGGTVTVAGTLTNNGVINVPGNRLLTPAVDGNGKIHFTGVTAGTTINFNNAGFTGTITADGNLEAQFGEGKITFVKPAPKGTLTPVYTRKDGFWGEGTSNSYESFVVELYEGETKIASASLNNVNGIIDGDLYVTWSIPFAGSTDEHWTVEWAEGYPNIDMKPTTGKLLVDGTALAESVVQFNAADNVNKIVAAAEDANGNFLGYYAKFDDVAAADGVANIHLMADATVTSELSFTGVNLIAKNGAKLTVPANTVSFTDSTLTDVTIEGAGTTSFSNTVNFYGTNNVTTGIDVTPFELIVNKDATLLISRFTLGYDRNITVYGNIADAHAFDPTGLTPSLKFNSTSGVSVGGNGTGNLTVENAYVELDSSSWKNAYGTYTWNFKNSYVSATSFTNNNSGSGTWTVTFDDSVLAAKNYIKNGIGTTYNFTNGSVATTGGLRIDGVLNIDATSSVTTTAQQNNKVGAVDEHGGINGTANIAGTLTIGSNAKTQLEVLGGTVNVQPGGKLNLGIHTLTLDATSTLTSSGSIIGTSSDDDIIAADGARVRLYGGTYTQDVTKWCAGGYTAKDNGNGTFTVKSNIEASIDRNGYTENYETLEAAINDARSGEIIYLATGLVTVDSVLTIDKDITIADYSNRTLAFVGEGCFHITGANELTLNRIKMTDAPVYADSNVAGAKVNGTVVTGVATEKSTIDSDGSTVTVTNPKWVAIIGNVYYTTLQAAIDAAKNGDIVKLQVPSAENVTITQQEGLSLTIDGGDNEYSGTMYIHGQARHTGTETLTIQNFKFNAREKAHDFISSDSTGETERYAHNVTVMNSSFNADEGYDTVVGLRMRQSYNVKLKGITATGLHSVMWATGGSGIVVDGLTATGCIEGGLSVGTSNGVEVKNSTITGNIYGIRADGNGAYSMTVTDCNIEANDPIVVRYATSAEAYNLTLNGTNNLTAKNEDGYKVTFTKDNSGTYTEPTGKFTLNGGESLKVYPTSDYVAKIGDKSYFDLHEAMVAAKAGETVLLIKDVDLAGTEWEPVSFKGAFNGQGHTISNLTINKPGVSNTGFITSLNGTFENVTFKDPTVTGGENTGVVAGRAGGGAAYAKDITITGTIKLVSTHSGYARLGAIVGGWAYGKYENITVDGIDKADSYIKHTGGGDGRYVAGIVGHADDVDSYISCTVKNITIGGGWLCGAIAGPGPSDGLVSNCLVENVDIAANYSGGMFGWYYGDGTIKDSTIKDVTFIGDSTGNGSIGGYVNNLNAKIENVTITNVKNKNDKFLIDQIAKIGDVYYNTLQKAIDAAQDGDIVTLLADSAEDVTITQQADLDLIINGNGKVYSGTFTIYGQARYNGEETLTFQNFKFKTSEASHYFIDSNLTGSVERYAHNVTVKDSTFTATNAGVNSAVAMRMRQAYDVSIIDVTATDMHSVLQAYGNAGVTIDKLNVDGKNGVSLGTSKDVKISNSTIDAIGYGIRADGTGAYDATVTNCDIDAAQPIIVRETTGDYNLKLAGNNELTGGEYAVIFTTGDDDEPYANPSAKFVLTGADGLKVYPVSDYVAKIGDAYHTSLQEAIDAAETGDTVTVIEDVVLTETLEVAADDVIILDLNGNTIDGTENVNIAVKSYGDLTVKDSSTEQTGEIKAGIGTAGNAVNICGGEFTLESGSIYSLNNAILIDKEAATININGGTITAKPDTKNSAALYISSTTATEVNITDGKIVGYNGILLWNNTTIDMTGGSIKAEGSAGIQGNGTHDNTEINISGDASVSGYYTAIYHPQAGDLNISGNATLTGWTGVVVKGGNVKISGGDISGTGQYNEYEPVSSGYVDTGDGLYIEHYDNSTNSGNYGTPSVIVTGGNFSSENGKAVASYANPNNNVEALKQFISGGTFTSDVSGLCVKGYVAEADGNGKFSIKTTNKLYVSSDYNANTPGYGVTCFSNYSGALNFYTSKLKGQSAEIVIEKNNTISGFCIDHSTHKTYKKLNVTVLDGAKLGNANSKWDLTYDVVIEPGATLQSARGTGSSVGNTHIKDNGSLTIGAAGSDKKAVVDFHKGTYQNMSIAVLWQGRLDANNAVINVGDLGMTGPADFNDSEINVNGIAAFGKHYFYSQTMTNSSMNIVGHNLMNENTYYSTTGTILDKLTMDNSKIVVNDGVDGTTAEKVTIKTLNMKNGSTVEVETETEVAIDGTLTMDTSSRLTVGTVTVGNSGKVVVDVTGLEANKPVILININNPEVLEGKVEVKGNAYANISYGDGKIVVTVLDNPQAQIGNNYYATLQAAIDAAKDGDIVTLLVNSNEDVTITQQEGLSLTIDGGDNEYSGTMYIHGQSRHTGTETLTIQNFKFTAREKAHDFISSNSTGSTERYAHNVTVMNSSFNADESYDTVVGLRMRQAYNVKLENIDATGLHSVMWATGVSGIVVDGLTATGCIEGGLSVGTSNGVVVKDSEINAGDYGIRADGDGAYSMTVTGCNIEANDPIVVRYATSAEAYKLTLEGTNNLKPNKAGGYQVTFTKDNSGTYNEPTGEFVLTGADGLRVYPTSDYVATIGDKGYLSIEAAFADANKAEEETTITLVKDIELNTMITANGKNIVLDLNGMTIAGTDTTAKNFSLIDNRGNLTIKDSSAGQTGKMTLTATIDSDWNRYSAVIANNPGGKLIIESGTLDHQGGTDMAYGIDNLTNGKGTYAETIINGGTIKSTYRGIRQFLNGVEAENILTINGGTVEGANKSVWMQDPSAKANTGELTIGENASLKGDVYLFVTAGSTEWPVEVSIHKDALVDEAENVTAEITTGNVPSGYELALVGDNYGVYKGVAKIGTVYYDSLAEAIAAVGDGDVVIELIKDASLDYGAREAYGTAGTTSLTIDGNGNTLTLNAKDTDWSSIGLANAEGTLVLNEVNIKKTSAGGNGAWNNHALNITSKVEMTDVTVDNSVAVHDDAVLNKVTINEAGGYYGLWITADGQTVTVNGGAINATNGGRGIKIADQYVDAPEKVTLSVTDTEFNTAKKAAVLVTSTAGADVTANNVDIADVTEDTTNFVWVDEERAEHYGKVTVTGGSKTQESLIDFTAAYVDNGEITGYYKKLQTAVEKAPEGETTIKMLANCEDNLTVTQAPGVKITIDGEGKHLMTGSVTVDGKSQRYETAALTIKNVAFNADSITEDASINLGGNKNIRYTNNVTVENCTFKGNGRTKVAVKQYTGGCKNLKLIGCYVDGMHSLVQLKNVEEGLEITGCTVKNSKNGISLGKSVGAVVSDCVIETTGYGIRADGDGTVTETTINNCTITANDPIVVRKVSFVKDDKGNLVGDYKLILEEISRDDLTANNDGDYQVTFTSGDDGSYVEPTGKFDISGAEDLKVYPVSDYEAAIGEKFYFKASQALLEAVSGETVTILKNVVGSYLTVFPGVTLDLNGYTLESNYLVGFNGSNVVDNSESNSGLLKCSNVVLSASNSQLPIWTGDGYIFVKIKDFKEQTDDLGNKKKYTFLPSFETIAHQYLAEGYASSKVNVAIAMDWPTTTGTAYQKFVYTDDSVKTVVNSYGEDPNRPDRYGLVFTAEIKTGSDYDTEIHAVLISDTGVEMMLVPNS